MSEVSSSEIYEAGEQNAPLPLGDDEFEGVRLALHSNIEQGLADPLLGLSQETEEALLRLAYTDIMGLERMERLCKAAIRDRNDGEPAAAKFSLGTYKRGATQLRKRLQEENARIAKMRQRNMRLLQGGKAAAREGSDVDLPEDTKMSVAAMCEAPSVFLRSLGLLLTFRRGRIWYDTFYGDYFTDWDGTANEELTEVRKVDDAMLLAVHEWLLTLDTKLGQSGSGNTEKALHRFADMDLRNEPKAWLNSLQWDGVERLPSLMATAYGTPDDEYHRAVGRCWFVSMAARISAPGCKVDTMPVLFGPQGTYKSTSLEVIGGKWYCTINTTADSKDFLDALRGVIVAEVAELDAIHSNKVENSRVKTLLSTRVDRYRPAYGRTTRDFPRTAVLAGTTNDAGWHRDDTGGRRFWPVHCVGNIDVEWLRNNREQLFAEARERYGRGESWSDVPREEQERLMAQHYTDDPWEERIASKIATWRLYTGEVKHVEGKGYVPRNDVEPVMGDPNALDEDGHWGTLLTTNRVIVAALGMSIERANSTTAKRVAVTLRKLGWKTHPVRVKYTETNRVVRAWIVTPNQGDEEAEKQGKLL
jgi:hypothetical protein